MRLILTAVLAVGLAVGAAWYLGLMNPESLDTTTVVPPGGADTQDTNNYGGPLYPPAQDPAAPGVSGPAAKADPLSTPASLVVFDKKKIPSQRDGVFQFIGTEVDPTEAPKPGSYKTFTISYGGKD